jgi:hypothetical protein
MAKRVVRLTKKTLAGEIYEALSKHSGRRLAGAEFELRGDKVRVLKGANTYEIKITQRASPR